MDIYAQLIKTEYNTAFGFVNVTSFPKVLKPNDMCHAAMDRGDAQFRPTRATQIDGTIFAL